MSVDPNGMARSDDARDAARYRALRRTENAAPWEAILGPHGKLDAMADTLVELTKAGGEETPITDMAILEAAEVLIAGASEPMGEAAGMAQAGGRRMDKTEKKKAPRLLEGGRYTIGQKYGPAMEITEPEEAAWYFEQCVRHSMSLGVVGISRDRAVSNERISIAYYAGYYDHETRLRVERLFHCAHPNFGKATESPVDPATALAKGVEA